MFIRSISQRISLFKKCKRGATAIEYGLIAALVGLSVVGGASATGEGIASKFATISYHISGSVPISGPLSGRRSE